MSPLDTSAPGGGRFDEAGGLTVAGIVLGLALLSIVGFGS